MNRIAVAWSHMPYTLSARSRVKHRWRGTAPKRWSGDAVPTRGAAAIGGMA